MRTLTITRHGGPEVLVVREAPDPVPGAGQLRIRVARAGLNFADVSARVGLYPDAPRPPMVMGYEVSGTVDALGAGVTGLAPGTAVLAFTRFGGQATHAVVDARAAFPLPPGMSLDQAAALPVNYVTAHLLLRVGGLQPGRSVLVHMAAGGVGLAVLQLCRAVGGVTVFGTASASKHAFLRQAGLDHPIDYRTTDWADEVRRLTGGRGVDLILDPLGGKDWDRGYQLLRPAGMLVCYGFANLVTGESRSWPRVLWQVARVRRWSPLRLMNDNRGVAGVNLGHLWGETALIDESMRALLDLFRRGAISPRVDRVFPLAEGAAAHRFLQERRNVGKVLFDCA
ncbi:MAG TPA: medium chain dehydrogenase/reductase family protein [Myxococcaceae bacterium]|nr:medium chain dehydrogenase/reductase family protein [Myxococcaceae bacterium]